MYAVAKPNDRDPSGDGHDVAHALELLADGCAWLAEAALTLPISSPELKSCNPCSTMLCGGMFGRKNPSSESIAVFCASVAPKTTRFVLA
jgi:hypothetical protein